MLDPKAYDVVILFSGGADSTLLVKMAISMGLRPLCLFVNYGQKHVVEYSSAKALAEKLKVMLTVCDFSLYGELAKSNLTTTATPIQYEGVNVNNVPFRNTFLLTLALAKAESDGIPLVWYGADFSDRINLFPDCYQEYVIKMNQLVESTASTKIKVEAPLMGMSKEVVKSILKNVFGISENEIHSGY
jgi:7-cyano-7-deazaguanine synthase